MSVAIATPLIVLGLGKTRELAAKITERPTHREYRICWPFSAIAMKIVGHRIESGIAPEPSGHLLDEGARVNDLLRAFPGGGDGFVPKGVYYFKTHAEANRHWEECLAAAMARLRNRR